MNPPYWILVGVTLGFIVAAWAIERMWLAEWQADAHAATLHGDRVVCTCGDFNCASLDYAAGAS